MPLAGSERPLGTPPFSPRPSRHSIAGVPVALRWRPGKTPRGRLPTPLDHGASRMRYPALVALFALALPACAPTSVQETYQRDAPLRRPDRILVYDFTGKADEVHLDRGIGSQLEQMASSETATEQETAIGRSAAKTLSQELVQRLGGMGLPAERAFGAPTRWGKLSRDRRAVRIDQPGQPHRTPRGRARRWRQRHANACAGLHDDPERTRAGAGLRDQRCQRLQAGNGGDHGRRGRGRDVGRIGRRRCRTRRGQRGVVCRRDGRGEENWEGRSGAAADLLRRAGWIPAP